MTIPRWTGYLAALAYLVCIMAANWLTAEYAPWFVAGVAITAGTWLIGPSFVLRDVVQLAHGRAAAYLLCGLALLGNLALSRSNGDLAWITLASACAFSISAVVDTETFTRLRARLLPRVAISGIGAGVLDSIVFVVVGLSPLTTGIVAWGDVWRVVVAQVVVKTVCVAVCSAPFYRARLAPA